MWQKFRFSIFQTALQIGIIVSRRSFFCDYRNGNEIRLMMLSDGQCWIAIDSMNAGTIRMRLHVEEQLKLYFKEAPFSKLHTPRSPLFCNERNLIFLPKNLIVAFFFLSQRYDDLF